MKRPPPATASNENETRGLRTWVKVSLAGVAVVILAFSAFAGMSAYYVLRHMETRSATETDTLRDFDLIRKRFGDRQPLVEITGPRAGDVRINRVEHPQGVRATTLHIVTWNAEDGELLRTDAPLWLMRFSTLNVLSTLGVAPEKFSLTAEDVARYGPGIVVDYRRPGVNRVLIWVE